MSCVSERVVACHPRQSLHRVSIHSTGVAYLFSFEHTLLGAQMYDAAVKDEAAALPVFALANRLATHLQHVVDTLYSHLPA